MAVLEGVGECLFLPLWSIKVSSRRGGMYTEASCVKGGVRVSYFSVEEDVVRALAYFAGREAFACLPGLLCIYIYCL